MQPIYNEYVQFLKDNNVDISWYKPNTFWLDNGIIKGFTSGGILHSLYKIKVKDDLTLEFSTHKSNKGNFNFETWDDTVLRMISHLEVIETYSIDMIKKYVSEYPGRRIIDTNSTGKDSVVKTHLAKLAGIDFKTYFNVTTLDVAESTLFAKQHGYEFIYPDIKKNGGFYQMVERDNIVPTRLCRFCCTVYKENPTIDNFDASEKLLFLFGMRNSESTKRQNYTDIWCNDKWGKRDWIGLLPIRTWNEFDVWLYILWRRLPVNEKYKMGYTRVGCAVCCPNYSKTTWILDKYWYNVLYARWRNILKNDFVKNNKWIIMNCTIDEYVTKAWCGGTYRSEPTKEVIEEYAKYSGLDYDVAEKYFMRTCRNGCKNNKGKSKIIKDKETLSMNLKIYGRNIEKFECKKCMMKNFGWSDYEWDEKVSMFKEQGCQLF